MTRVLVTGATGNVGRMVVDELLEHDLDVRALTVDPERARLPQEVEIVVGSLGRPESCRVAFDGVDRVYLAPFPETAEVIVDQARSAGVERIVDLSGEHDSWWGAVTRAVENGGVPWTHLWPGDFMENTLVWAEQIRRHRQVRDFGPRAVSTPIAMHDIARVAAHALIGDDLVGAALSLTGPEALSRQEMVRLIGEAIGEDVGYVQLSRAEAAADLWLRMGEFTETYLDMIAELVDQPVQPSALVAELVGRATTFRAWAATRAIDFR